VTLALKLHQAASLVSVKSLTFFFLFLFCLASRLGLGYEALGNKSLNCVTLGWSCTKQLALWVWKVWLFFFNFFFAFTQGRGLVMKLSVTRAWICDSRLKLHQAAGLVSVKSLFFLLMFFFGLHQGLGLIRMLSKLRAWIFRLSVEAPPSSWPCKCEKSDFLFFNFFLPCLKARSWLWSSR
jgi:hypothetical protein